MMRWTLACLGMVLVAGCADGEPSQQGQAATRITEAQWRANGQLAPGDEFSASERECVARNGDDLDVDLDELEASSFAGATGEVREYVSRNADECFTDEHLQSFFVADMQDQGFTPQHASCMAPEVLALVRRHGFAEVFDDRTAEVAQAFEDLRSRCGVEP